MFVVGCELRCDGDNACEGDPTDARKIGYYNIKNSHGMSCSHDSCRRATYELTSNVGGVVDCNGQEACVSADIAINNVAAVVCHGIQACQMANIVVYDPQDQFELDCSGYSFTPFVYPYALYIELSAQNYLHYTSYSL